jgi:DNA repair exonuclease SbcCD ATPase subunit
MRFAELNIENFLVLTQAKVSLADRGLVLVQGINSADTSANSNGSGKSSLADALCWAIYGVTARGETGDAVVNNKAGKNTRVEVVILDDMITYRIVRHRKHKTGKNTLHVFMDDGMTGEKDLTKGTDKLTQEVVDKIIGASLDVFTGSIYAGQEKMPDLPSMTDKMLKLLIEEAAGINALEEAYKKARENFTAAKIDAMAVESEIGNLKQAADNLRRQLADTIQMEVDWEANRQAQTKALTDRVRDQLLPEASKLASEAPQSEIDRLTNEIAAIDAKISAVSQEQAQLQRLSNELALASSAKTLKGNAELQARASVQSLTQQLAAVDHKVGCPCDSCGRPLTNAELAAARSAVQIRLDQAKVDFANATVAAEDAENALYAAQRAHDAFKQRMTDLSKEVAQRASIEAQRAILTQKEHRRQQIVAQARNDMETIKRLKAEASPFEGKKQTIQKSIDTIDHDAKLKQTELSIKQRRAALENEVVRVFSPAGVRARVLDEVTPYLNGQTSKYLSILSDGNITAEWSTLTMNKAGELKERFAIDVSSVSSSQTFKGLSGGEKRKVRVATALALQDLVATRATKPIDLFIGDEIDHALDASGLERLMVILDEKARERGTVMVISHNSLRDEISNVLLVERTSTGDTVITESVS